MLKHYPTNGGVAACFLSFLLIAQPGCILLEEPPPNPDFAARAAQSADTGFADIYSADTDEALPPILCETNADCEGWPESHHITSVCGRNGTCTYYCAGDFEDCDGDMEVNGCEVDLATNLDHCGVCGEVCELKSLNYQPICAPTGEDRGVAYKCDVAVGVCASGYAKSEDEMGCVLCEGAVDEEGQCITREDG